MTVRSLVQVIMMACFGAGVLLLPLKDARAESTGKAEARARPHVPADIVVTHAHIFLIKFALRLRPEQEPHWTPVENALRELALRQAKTGETTTPEQRAEVVTRLRQIGVMARQFMKALDDSQRQSMMSLARSAGLEQLLVASH